MLVEEKSAPLYLEGQGKEKERGALTTLSLQRNVETTLHTLPFLVCVCRWQILDFKVLEIR